MREEWYEQTLGEFAHIRQGKYLSKNMMADQHSKTSPIPVHGANGVIGWSSDTMYQDGVPLVTCRGSNCGMILWASGPLWVSNNAMAVFPKDKGDSRFLYYFLLNSPPYEFVSGSAQPQITMRDLSKKRILLPPLAEQRVITGVLGALDDKIALNRRMNTTLERLARALFRDWFVDFGPTRAKEAGLPPYLPPELWSHFPEHLDEDGIPEGWEVSTIGEEVKVQGGSTPSTKELKFWDGGIHWATPKDLSTLTAPVLLETMRTISGAGLEKISSGLLPVGTVLLSSRAPIGYLAIAEVPLAVNQGFITMTCDKRLSNMFVWLWTQANMDAIKANANGSTFQEISKRNFRPLQVIVPSVAVLEAFDAVVEPIYRQIVQGEEESRTLAQTRDLLLPRLMSGELRVAEVERIASEAV